MRVFSLVISKTHDDGHQSLRVMPFLTSLEKEEAERAVRNAVKDHLETPEGRKSVENRNGRFNWEDAMFLVPYSTYAAHGLTLAGYPLTGTVVDRDENLAETTD